MPRRKFYKPSEIQSIARELLNGLKPKGMAIRELREVFETAIEMLDFVPYGEPILVPDPDEAE